MINENTIFYSFDPETGRVSKSSESLIIDDNLTESINLQENGFSGKREHIQGAFADSCIEVYAHNNDSSEKFMVIFSYWDLQYYFLITGVFELNHFFKFMSPMFKRAPENIKNGY